MNADSEPMPVVNDPVMASDFQTMVNGLNRLTLKGGQCELSDQSYEIAASHCSSQ